MKPSRERARQECPAGDDVRAVSIRAGGRSLKKDREQKVETVVPSGQGDKGD